MKFNDKMRLQHMLDAAQEAVSFLDTLKHGTLEHNRLVSQAIVRSIEIVGEAASQLSKEYKENNPELPWAQIIGMRNRIIHAYFDIDYALVESTVKQDLPVLIGQLTKLLSVYK
ncbi:MAG: DUF86 domain-containing protein [Smithellaceae bacterium]|nr:DUF86 domain-containing protein [Smithellaceae bacterium]